MLLLDVKSSQNALKTANLDIETLKLKFDQSLLGEYTKYAIENSIKSANGQQMICSAVASCSDTKKSKAAAAEMEKKLKSFDEFRKGQLELLKRSIMPSGNPGPAAAGAGVSN